MNPEEVEEKWTEDDQLALEGRQFLCEHESVTPVTHNRFVFPKSTKQFKLREIKQIPTGTSVVCLDCCKEFEKVVQQ